MCEEGEWVCEECVKRESGCVKREMGVMRESECVVVGEKMGRGYGRQLFAIPGE